LSGLLDLDEFEVACKELGIPNDKMEAAFQVVSGIKRNKLWRDMDKETQTMWTALGWTQSLWDEDGKASNGQADKEARPKTEVFVLFLSFTFFGTTKNYCFLLSSFFFLFKIQKKWIGQTYFHPKEKQPNI
jgi:hypothetical protein